MKNSLLNISEKIDPVTVEIFSALADASQSNSMSFVVVGASARDIVLHHGYDAPIKRATTDIDFGIQVADWIAYEKIKTSLINLGFSQDRQSQRLISPKNIKVDIVPFGGVEDDSSKIAWPPSGDIVMNTCGFKEACDNALLVRISNNPVIDIPVATPASMTLLKIIAWSDRDSTLRRKDATDLRYLLETYSEIPDIKEILFNEKISVLESYDWDNRLAGAALIGEDAKSIATEDTIDNIRMILDMEDNREAILEDMCDQGNYDHEHEYGRVEILLTAYKEGFFSSD